MNKNVSRLILNISFFWIGFCFAYFNPLALLSKQSNSDFFEALSSRYPLGFDVKTADINGMSVGCVHNTGGKNLKNYGSYPDENLDPVVFAKTENEVLQIYEIDMEPGQTWNEICSLMDTDNDGVNELVTEWKNTAGGSYTGVSLVIWKKTKDNKLVPITGYPEEWRAKLEAKVRNIETGEVESFPQIENMNIVSFEYMEDDSAPKLEYAKYRWDLDAGEGHFSPHIWELTRYELKGNKFVRDRSWNNGQTYVTQEKIEPSFEGEDQLRSLFYEIEQQ